MQASALSLLARLRGSRRASLITFAVALGALLFAAVLFNRARSSLNESYARIGERQQALTAANQRMQEARLRVRLAGEAQALVNDAVNGGFVVGNWGERLINVEQAPLNRQEVNDLLSGTTRDGNRLFGADAFELSVSRPDEGLFDAPGARGAPLMLTLRGTLLFRTQFLPPDVAMVPTAAFATAPSPPSAPQSAPAEAPENLP